MTDDKGLAGRGHGRPIVVNFVHVAVKLMLLRYTSLLEVQVHYRGSLQARP